jgi:Fe-S-cluster containining protein
MPSLDCGGCRKCEDAFYAPFFPRVEDWKLKYYKDAVFLREGIWFLGPIEGDCPFFKEGRCAIYGKPWRPIECQIYPCYVDEEGELKVDYEGCPKASMVDQRFIEESKALIDSLGLKKEELKAWARVALKHEGV